MYGLLIIMQRSVHLRVLIMGPVPLQIFAAVQQDGLEALVTQVAMMYCYYIS